MKKVLLIIALVCLAAGICWGRLSLGVLTVSSAAVATSPVADAQALVAEGKSQLAAHNIQAARDKFKQAVLADAANQEAQLLYGVTRVFAVYEDGQSLNTSGLDSVREIFEQTGFIFSSFNLYDTRGTAPQQPSPTTPTTGAAFDFLKNKLLPEVDGAIANLGNVTSQSFSSSINAAAVAGSSGGSLDVDYADARMIRAFLYALKCNIELLQVYGLDVHIPSLMESDPDQLMTYKTLFANDPELLAPKDAPRLAAAKTALTNFIDTYTEAAGYITARTGSGGHLFVVDVPVAQAGVSSSTEELTNIKFMLAEIKASLSGPRTLSFLKGKDRHRYIDLSKFFNSAQPINFRTKIAGNGTVFPDKTFGGLIPMGVDGLEEIELQYGPDILGVMLAGYETPNIHLSPDYAYVYEEIAYGYKSAPVTLSIRNTGTAPLAVSSISLQGRDSGDFQLLQDTCPSFTPTLQPAAECSVRVEFKPTSAGNKLVDVLVGSNDANTPKLYSRIQGYSDGAPFLSSSPGTRGFVEDPDASGTLYAGVYGSGVFKTTDGGATWTPMNTGLANTRVQALALDSTNKILYAGTFGGGVYKSTNGGAWTAVNSGLTFTHVYSLAVSKSAPQVVYAGTHGGLFKSVNSGSSWTPVGTGELKNEIRKIQIDPVNVNTVYVMGYSFLHKTTDGGATWTNISRGVFDYAWLNDFAINPLNSAVLYMASFDAVYKSTDGGSTWALKIGGQYTGLGINGIAVSPSAPSTVYLMTYNGIYGSTTGGDQWSQLGRPDGGSYGYLTVSRNDANKLYFVDFYGSVHESSNGGTTWSNIAASLDNSAFLSAFAVNPASTETMYAGTYGGGVRKSTNGGATWTSVNSGLGNKFINDLALDQTNAAIVYAATDAGIFKTQNSGGTWTAASQELTGTVRLVRISPSSSSTLFAVDNSGLYMSTNGGVNWGSPVLSQYMRALAFSKSSSSVIYAGTDGGVFKSTNSGASWQVRNNGLTDTYGLPFSVFALAVDPLNSSIAYAGTYGGLYKSTDGGGTWSKSSNGLTTEGEWTPGVTSIIIDQSNPAKIYAGTDYGAYRSADAGASWTRIETGGTFWAYLLALPVATPQYLLAAGSAGIYKIPLAESQVPTYQFTYTRLGTGTGGIRFFDGEEESESKPDSFTTMVEGGEGGVFFPEPGINSVFAGWTGCDSIVEGNGCQVTMHEAKNITATFNLDTRPLSLVASPAGGSYTLPPQVSLVANKDGAIYYTLNGTTPTTSSMPYTGPIQLTGNTTLKYISALAPGTVKTDTYTVQNFTLTATVSGGGSINSDPSGIIATGGTQSVQLMGGTQVTLMATAGSGYQFSGWSGACAGAGDCNLFMDGNKSVTANFGLLPYVRIYYGSTNIVYYSSLQAVMNSFQAGGVVQARDLTFTENLLLDNPVPVYFRGGYTAWTGEPTGVTILNGSLAIGAGSLIVDGLAVK